MIIVNVLISITLPFNPLFEYNPVDLNPFLRYVFFINHHMYSLTFVLLAIYYLIKGPELFDLMNNDCIAEIYRQFNPKKCQIIFGVVFFYINLSYIIYYSEYLYEDKNHFNIFQAFNFYISNLYILFYLLVVHYIKYATYQQIRRKYHQLQYPNKTNSSIKYSQVICQLIDSVQILANVNRKFNSLYSLIFLVNFSCNIIDMTISTVNLTKKDFHSICINTFFVVVTTAYLLLIGCIDSNLYHLLNNIKRDSNSILLKQCRKKKYRKYFIKLYEIDVYLEYFQVNIFNVFNVNLKFIFKTIIFITDYAILIIQTNH